MKRVKNRQQKNRKRVASKRQASVPAKAPGHKARFEQLLDDAVLGVKKK